MNAKTKIKICGLTRFEDAALAQRLGAWALGFIFYPRSPRAADPVAVKEIIAQLPSSPIKTVGVFVNPTLAELAQTISITQINTIQLHGNETHEFCAQVKKQFPQTDLIKVTRVANPLITEPLAEYHLIDSESETQWGGTGKKVDWNKISTTGLNSVILAGGLTPENVALAIQIVNPFAVDVSSGVEVSPGIKSNEKIRSFFSAIGNL